MLTVLVLVVRVTHRKETNLMVVRGVRTRLFGSRGRDEADDVAIAGESDFNLLSPQPMAVADEQVITRHTHHPFFPLGSRSGGSLCAFTTCRPNWMCVCVHGRWRCTSVPWVRRCQGSCWRGSWGLGAP